MTVATQTEQLDDGWVSEPDTDQPKNEQENVDDILSRLCAMWRPYIVPNSHTDQVQATEPPAQRKRKGEGRNIKTKALALGTCKQISCK